MVLTKKQQIILDFIKNFLRENGYSPSYREIAMGLGISSVSTVSEHVDNLVAKGFLVKKDGSARSLEPVDMMPEVVEMAPEAWFKAQLAEFEAKLPETEDDVATLKKAAELLGVKLT